MKKKQVVVVGGKESKVEPSHHKLEVGNRGKEDCDLKKIIAGKTESTLTSIYNSCSYEFVN